jgi:hypothetical protein
MTLAAIRGTLDMAVTNLLRPLGPPGHSSPCASVWIGA